MEISSTFLQISGLILISLAFFYLGKHWSNVSHQLIFFNSRQTPLLFQNPFPYLSLSSNLNKTFDLNPLINNTNQTSPSPIQPYLQFHLHPIQNHFLRCRKRGSGLWTRTERCRVILRSETSIRLLWIIGAVIFFFPLLL
ncbi:putative methyltransferase PMT11 [Camellia lanceoleosa]|uniref:Methyltransferase PMT11 n=1 Tax=Camellia lanceoleosa TaxID=1840588 RepID=A0ACC0G5J8_9ERIC|nr:putative methyltransferase PMT11 [Camellia lanceoleosa]